MEGTSHIDHKMEIDHSTSNGAPLSRQVTVTMSPDQYERLFFQPSAPVRGDLAKRFGNPTLLGLICFLIPYTSTIFILIGWGGAVPPTSLAGLSGDYYFLGSIGMVLAGLAEFVLGNTYPFAVSRAELVARNFLREFSCGLSGLFASHSFVLKL